MDRRNFFAAIGAAGATSVVPTAVLAEALEHRMIEELEPQGGQERELEPMPEKPTLEDFFKLRFTSSNHVLQSATRAMKTGQDEEVILSCLLHDLVLTLQRPDHGWWGGQLFEPYVPETVSWAIRYHQPLRFYPDPSVDYEYPEMYYRMFGRDYVPEPYIEEAYNYARNHKWYMRARLITMNDEYSFDRNAEVSLDPFIDIIGRHFKQPKEGLGFDNSPVAHMWRTIINPNRRL
jgi:hypothetical protein